MKQTIALLLCSLLLCGCAGEIRKETTEPTVGTTAISTENEEGLYDAGSALEQSTRGSVRVYPLNCSDAYDLRLLGEKTLILSGVETTTLTLLTGEKQHPVGETVLDFYLNPREGGLCIQGDTVTYYDPVNQELVVLDGNLRPVRRIAAPEDLSGAPVLSRDRNAVYYCSETALRVWDLESGIRRTLREMAYPGQRVIELIRDETVLHCRTENRSLFLSTEDGRLLQEWEGEIALFADGSSCSAAVQLGHNPVLIYQCAEKIQMLLPEVFPGTYFPDSVGAVACTEERDGSLKLEYYDLADGTCVSRLALPTARMPDAVRGSRNGVYMLAYDDGYGCSTLYRWDPAGLPSGDSRCYAVEYATEEQPLTGSLALCRQYAQQLSEKYGIQILVGMEAVKTQPWDYTLEAETQPSLLLQELMLLDSRLSRYPQTLLAQTAEDFSGLKLCLVRSVTGLSGAGNVHDATGVQFLAEGDAHVVITTGKYSEQALYHELFHAMETHIFNSSIAFDQWDSLNPSGFVYDYASDALRDAGIYLEQEGRAFIDRYSMSFPKEDRARIMEYAMLDGNRELFELPGLQAKLRTVCQGIREAYDLEGEEGCYPWEQYLS